MSGYYGGPANNPGYGAQNLQFYPSSYSPAGAVSGHATPSQASYGYGAGASGVAGSYGAAASFGAGPSGRMGEQGGLRTGWLSAFSTEGYPGEPPLLEELGINFGHIQAKVHGLSLLGVSLEDFLSRIDAQC
jgi:protein YIPF5/7